MADVGRDLWRSPCPIPPARAGPPGIRLLAVSEDGDYSFFGHPVAVLGHPQKIFFLMFTWNLLCFSLCPLPPVLSLVTSEQECLHYSRARHLGHCPLLNISFAEITGKV